MTMPQEGQPGQPWDSGQQPGPSGQQWQGSAPGQPNQGQGKPGYPSQAGGGGQQPGGAPPGYGYGMTPASPVSMLETHVSGRRIVQYIIDSIIAGVVAGLISWALDRGTGATHAILILVLVVLDIVWYFLYWAYWPWKRNGQTFGMTLLALRIISKDGGPAGIIQLVVRGILLIIDTLFLGLVGFITMMLSTYRQRLGDHAAKTLVVRARTEPIPARQEYASAGQAGGTRY